MASTIHQWPGCMGGESSMGTPKRDEQYMMAELVDDLVKRAEDAAKKSKLGPKAQEFTAADYLLDLRTEAGGDPANSRELVVIDDALNYLRLGTSVERGRGIGGDGMGL